MGRKYSNFLKKGNPLSKLKKPFGGSARQKFRNLRKERINRKNAKQLSIDKSFYKPPKHVFLFPPLCSCFVFCGSINVSSIAFYKIKFTPKIYAIKISKFRLQDMQL